MTGFVPEGHFKPFKYRKTFGRCFFSLSWQVCNMTLASCIEYDSIQKIVEVQYVWRLSHDYIKIGCTNHFHFPYSTMRLLNSLSHPTKTSLITSLTHRKTHFKPDKREIKLNETIWVGLEWDVKLFWLFMVFSLAADAQLFLAVLLLYFSPPAVIVFIRAAVNHSVL